MVGPAHQGQVGQVGGAAMEPVAQMVGLAPGRGSVAAGKAQPPSRTARAARWAAVTTRLVRPTSSGWVGPPPRAGGSRVAAARSRAARLVVAAGVVAGVGPVAGDQDPGDGAVTGQPPARLGVQRPAPPVSPPSPPGGQGGCPGPRSPAAGGGPRRSGGAGRLPGCGGPARPGHRRGAGHQLRSSSASVGRARGSRAASRVWPASGSNSPSMATMPSQVGDSHRPRRCWRRSAWSSAPSGSATSRRWATARRSRGGSSRRAASSRTGSASAARWSGRSWVPAASTWAWAGEMVAGGQGLGGGGEGAAVQGPGGADQLAAVPALMRSRCRSQPAVEPAWTPCSAPAAPRASTPASSASQWPSRRSTSPRSTMTRSARAPSASPSGSWAARLSELGHQRRQPCWCPGRVAGRMGVRVHGGNLSGPHQNTSTQPQNVDNLLSAPNPPDPKGPWVSG